MKTIPFALLLMFIFSCTKESTKDKWMDYYNQYFLTADKASLDSALFYIDKEMKDDPEEKWVLYTYKLTIYSIQQEYDKALSTCFNDTVIIDERFPFFQQIIKERFLAMKAQYHHDDEERNHYLTEIMKTISNYMTQNGNEMANLLDKRKSKEQIDGHIILLRYYFQCKTIVDGKSASLLSLDSLYKTHQNMDCYDELHKLITDFSEDELLQFSL